jgi:hypothetical protein
LSQKFESFTGSNRPKCRRNTFPRLKNRQNDAAKIENLDIGHIFYLKSKIYDSWAKTPQACFPKVRL